MDHRYRLKRRPLLTSLSSTSIAFIIDFDSILNLPGAKAALPAMTMKRPISLRKDASHPVLLLPRTISTVGRDDEPFWLKLSHIPVSCMAYRSSFLTERHVAEYRIG